MKPNADWLSPEVFPKLTPKNVHVWRASLALDPAVLRELGSILSDDERVRAQRFVRNRDRDSFTAARGILRHLLGRYLECEPQTIDFSYGSNGKPELNGACSREPVRFNLSHSHGVALFAVALDRSVGIDVELVREESAGEDIAERYFSAREASELRSLPAAQQVEGFFLCWTRKEAYLKARGAGLKIPLNSFHVSLSPGLPVTLTADDEGDWSIESIARVQGHTKNNYAAALVVGGKNHTTAFFEWNQERLGWRNTDD